MVRPKKQESDLIDKIFKIRLTQKELANLQGQKKSNISMNRFIRSKLFLNDLEQCPSNLILKTLTDMTDSFDEILKDQKRILEIFEEASSSGNIDDAKMELIIKNWRKTEEAHKKTQRFISRLLTLYANS